MNDPTVFKPNLKGMMVGNGLTNYKYDLVMPYIDMSYWHSLLSFETWDTMTKNNCDYQNNLSGDETF